MCAGSEAIVRELLSCTDILDNVLRKNLPLALRSNYLLVLDQAYLFAERGGADNELLAAEQTPKMIVALIDQVCFLY